MRTRPTINVAFGRLAQLQELADRRATGPQIMPAVQRELSMWLTVLGSQLATRGTPADVAAHGRLSEAIRDGAFARHHTQDCRTLKSYLKRLGGAQ